MPLSDESGIGPLFLMSVLLAACLITLTGMARVFAKAGQPGWLAFVPIANAMVLCRVAGKSEWVVLLLFIPVYNVYVAFKLMDAVAVSFGKDKEFGVGLFWLPFVFFHILASSEYLRLDGKLLKFEPSDQPVHAVHDVSLSEYPDASADDTEDSEVPLVRCPRCRQSMFYDERLLDDRVVCPACKCQFYMPQQTIRL